MFVLQWRTDARISFFYRARHAYEFVFMVILDICDVPTLGVIVAEESCWTVVLLPAHATYLSSVARLAV